MKKLLLLVGLLFLLGAACQKKTTTQTNTPAQNLNTNSSVQTNTNATATTTVQWMQIADGWQANGTPPACPTPLMNSPVDLANATSILYPGQIRGGNYKPHGGFRFDQATTSNIDVTAPADAVIVRGARYLVNGESQYTFDFIMPCGVMYRLGHLLTLSAKYQAIVDQFPPAQEADSRTTNVSPQIAVIAGETIATAVGVTQGGLNVFFDFGVYDLKQKNAAAADAAYAASHDPELAQHALCWFDSLPTAAAATVKSLPPADSASGKNSDYCH